jgi:hypothetical protein
MCCCDEPSSWHEARMRRILALSSLVLVACPRASAPDAGSLPLPTKVVIGGVEHSESTEAFREPEPWPPLLPLTQAQQGLVARAKERFFELADAEHLPRGCDDASLQVQALPADSGMLMVSFRLAATADEWTGEGCCTPCATPCVPGSCGYCSPADSCQHFATHRVLRVSFELGPDGHVRSELLTRQSSERQLVPAEVIVPFVPLGPNRRGAIVIGVPEIANQALDRAKLEAYFRSRKGAVLGCYERELRRDPSLAGKLSLRFVITPAGRSSDLELDENALNVAVGACVRTVVRGWVFPFKPEQNVTVVIPFSFAIAAP